MSLLISEDGHRARARAVFESGNQLFGDAAPNTDSEPRSR
jgi:hypothetical protein